MTGTRATGWKAFTAVAALVVATAGVFIVAKPGGADLARDVDDSAQAVAAALASVAAFLAARRHTGRAGKGWGIMAAGLAMWGAGQLLWCWWEIVQGIPAPFPSLADVGFLGFSAFATVGVCLVADEDRRISRVRTVVDGLIVAGALLIISWATALGVTVHSGGSVDLSLIVSLAYPVGDIVLLTMTVQMLTRVPGARWSLVALGTGTVALAIADSSYTYLSAVGRYHTGDPLDLGWIGGFGLIAVAASRAAAPTARAVRSGRSRRLVFLPYAVLIVAGVVVAGLVLSGRRLDGFEAVMAILVVFLVLVRQYLTVVDNQELMRTVEAREAQLSHQAFHDDLTGLPNRALFNDRVAHALELHRAHGRPLAVLFCDLDDFKVVNDTLGHRAGDDLLVRVADRLRGAVRPGDTLSRLGGDEFAVLVEGGDATHLGERLIDVLAEPFILDGRRTAIHASIGISSVGTAGPTPSSSHLLADADTAMYAVKRSGKSGSRQYHASMRLTGIDDLDLRQDLVEALESGAVGAVYQPIVDPVTGRVHALECLARWERSGIAVSPGVFVPLAERLGVVQQLTDHMLEVGVAQLAAWSVMLGHHRLRLNVNVSASELGPSGRLVERVVAVLARHAVRSEQLVVEITETAVAADAGVAGEVLRALRDLGVHVALDDFGVGQSSLSRLREFPIDYLKLDVALVRRTGEDETQARFVRSITELGHHLGMEVVAEGVEHDSQLRRLAAFDRPPLLQGYLLARPAPAAGLTSLLVRGLDVRSRRGEGVSVGVADAGGPDDGGQAWDGRTVEPLGR